MPAWFGDIGYIANMTTRTRLLKPREPWTTFERSVLVNVHRRPVSDPDAARALLHRVHEPTSGVWPADAWPPMVLDRGLERGSSGGHGPIRYSVAVAEADRVRFVFPSDGDLSGFHELRIEGDTLVHELRIEHPNRAQRWTVLPLHDAVIEDLFDNIEALLAGAPHPPSRRWTLRVRVLRAIIGA